MAILKSKEIAKMGKDEMDRKLRELRLELIKSKAGASKSGTSKIKEIKKTISRILTLNKSGKEALTHK